jgi:hypothetical protein
MLDTLTSDMFEITNYKYDAKVDVTTKESAPKISTNQCLKMHLVDKNDNIVDSKSLSSLATSCELIFFVVFNLHLIAVQSIANSFNH